jgi:transcriptional regulator with XRE-family HTH domain
MSDIQRRQELASFLVSRRNQLRPSDFGIAVNRRRRTPGLRREEVAQHAGISATWYVRLEQGRDIRASAHTLQLIARALRLTPAEQLYLVRLARPDLQGKPHGQALPQPSPNLLSLLNGLTPHPAYILDRYWHVVAMNDPATRLLGAFREDEPWGNHLIARLFLDPDWRRLFRDWNEVARSAVAQFRLSLASKDNDRVLVSIVSELEDASDDFRTLWSACEIAEPPIWRKTLVLPTGENRAFDFASLRASGVDSEFSISIYTTTAHLPL